MCWSRPQQHATPTNAGQCGLSASNADTTHPELHNIKHVTSSDPAPLIRLDIITANGSCTTKTLLDSGADILAADKTMLSSLNAQVTTLLPSKVIPKAVNGAKMFKSVRETSRNVSIL